MVNRWAYAEYYFRCVTRNAFAIATATAGALLLIAASEPSAATEPRVDFIKDIQPILANHCWSCHGPDEKGRHADLRLDVRDVALATHAIVPGDSAKSGLVSRIDSNDAEAIMPPPDSKKPLSEKQKELLKLWIAQGAEYASHWAFVVPSQVIAPETSSTAWVKNPIDAFVLHGLDSAGLKPSAEADAATLLRRLSLDLTGLPPTLEQLEAFVRDPSEQSYEQAVDRMLSSPAYAERMAMNWLDLARYADTNGYNNDEDRSMWPWRDWVIRAFESNMPYDQFIVEQLAGDLLPNPTRDQLIATAFLRNQGHNTEGGIIAEEYRVEYVADRVHTTATVFLGMSMQCARCHDHKYDPITQSDYYRFFAYFNNLDEKQASYSKFVAAEPFLRVPSKQQEEQIASLTEQIALAQSEIDQREKDAPNLLAKWLAEHSEREAQDRFGFQLLNHLAFDDERTDTIIDSLNPNIGATIKGNVSYREGKKSRAVVFSGDSHIESAQIADFDGQSPFSISVWVYPTATDAMAIVSRMDEGNNHRGFDLLIENGKIASHFVHKWPDNAVKVITKEAMKNDQWHHVVLTYDGGRNASSISIYVDSQQKPVDVTQNSLRDTIHTDKPFHVGLRERSLPFRGAIDDLQLFRGVLQNENVTELYQGMEPTPTGEWLRRPASERTEEQNRKLNAMYLKGVDDQYAKLLQRRSEKQNERAKVEDETAAVMIMKEMATPRETFILKRGQYDQPAERVNAGIPQALSAMKASSPSPEASAEPRDRLALARWIVDPSNPLTARVAVNRWWQNYFGTGIVKTVEDFGVTGEAPSHPELLDFLARKLIDTGWDVKSLQKMIVMSATYRQSSSVTPALLDRDPENRLLARGPRFRLAAESVRDNALAISGLLRTDVGGPSVKPYQPAGLWEDVTVERRGRYVQDQGDGLYRRSMYTFWKRTCPPPSMMNFDAPNREVCLARRARTNTPLQSLVLMNDPTYIEAARFLAQQMIRSGGADAVRRIQHGMLRCVAREADSSEVAIFERVLADALNRFSSDEKAATDFNAIGVSRADAEIAPGELAAWTVVASMMLNLDETISKR